MLQQLFNKVGFGWAVRISAFVCLACGIIATALVSSRLPKRKPGPWVDNGHGISQRCQLCNLRARKRNFLPGYLRTNVLHRPIHPRTQHLPNPRIRRPLHNARRQRIQTHRPINPSRPNRKVQHADPIHSPNGHLHPRTLVPRTGSSNIITYSVFYGFFSGNWFALQTSCIAQISKMEKIGVRMGMAYSLVSFAALVGEPIAGAILARENGSYTGLIVFTGVSSFLWSSS
ncbi:hypothetical protein P692DRAFT_20875825 [Suillus brevipes Sb2]|nr:hypothetical protein P692DRAFT_20875825 [Suillus brevipes Sb2]